MARKFTTTDLAMIKQNDALVHQNADQPEWGFAPEVTEDGKYLVLTVWQGTDDRYRILYKSLDQPDQPFKVLVELMANEYSFLGNNGSQFFFKSDLDAPRKRIVVMDVAKNDQNNLTLNLFLSPSKPWRVQESLATP